MGTDIGHPRVNSYHSTREVIRHCVGAYPSIVYIANDNLTRFQYLSVIRILWKKNEGTIF